MRGRKKEWEEERKIKRKKEWVKDRKNKIKNERNNK